MTTQTIQIYLTVRGGLNAVAWYEKTWNAKQEMLHMADDGKRVLHATLSIFGGHIMLSDEFPDFETYVTAPPTKDATTVTIHINPENREALDQAMQSAQDNGARITMPAADMPWGAYYGRLVDPFGHSWSFAAE
jgi:PhnB protein